MSIENKKEINKKENKNYFDYENTKIIEHFGNNNVGLYSSICCVVLLIFMIIYSAFSSKGFLQSFFQFEALRILFEFLGSLLQVFF
jgi:uncharacterized membrane protein